jgi:hypothetical protein
MTENDAARDHGRRFWAGVAVGAAVIAFGVRGALHDAAATEPRWFFMWIVGADVVHDLLVAPIACLVGVVVIRRLPRSIQAPVRAGLVVSAVVVAVGWPAWRGYGRDTVPDNATVQPLDYVSSIITVLAAVWTAVAVWSVAAVVAGRRSARIEPPKEDARRRL